MPITSACLPQPNAAMPTSRSLRKTRNDWPRMYFPLGFATHHHGVHPHLGVMQLRRKGLAAAQVAASVA